MPFSNRRHFIIVFAVLFIMCREEQGVVEVYEDNTLVERYTIDQDSLRHGLTEKYFSSGKAYEQSHYKHGKLTGERILFYENGSPEIIERYCDGMICDTIRTYFEDGTLKFEAVYVNSEMTGLVRSFYQSGNLKEEVSFKENIEEGPFVEYHLNGRIKWKGTYLNGPNEFGLLSEYDSTGILIRKMMCDSLAICQTIWTPQEGDIQTKRIFE